MSAIPSTKIDKARTLRGGAHVFGDICLVYPAIVDDITDIGTDTFFRYLQYITVNPVAVNPAYKNISSFDYILQQAAFDEHYKNLQGAISFFLKEEVLIIPEAKVLALGGSDGVGFTSLTPELFEGIQDVVRQQHWLEPLKSTDSSTANARTREIMDKIQANRAIVDKIKNKNSQNGDQAMEFHDVVGSMSVAISSLNIANIGQLTYYALYDQYYRYQQKRVYETNMRSALAGAKVSKDKMKDWLRPIEK